MLLGFQVMDAAGKDGAIKHVMSGVNPQGSQVFSFKEQKKRFLERIEEPQKNWKFSAADAKERHYRKAYMDAYEDMIRKTATKAAPWYVVPADNKWFTRVVVAAAVIRVLDDLDLNYPKVSDSKLKELAAAKKELLAGRDPDYRNGP